MHSKELANLAEAALDDLKANDVRVIDVSRLTSITDFMIVASGRSDRHVRSIADSVIASSGLRGIIAYKFSLMMVVILACEVIGRRRPRIARNVIRGAIGVTALPVVLSILQLILH